MHIVYFPEKENWDLFFQEQVGGGINPYFEGELYKRGYQVGSGFGTIVASLLPYLIPIAKQVGREGLAFGSRVLGSLAQDEPIKQTLKKEGIQSIKNLASSKFKQSGEGKKKRRTKTNHSLIGKKLKTTHSFNSSSLKDPFEF